MNVPESLRIRIREAVHEVAMSILVPETLANPHLAAEIQEAIAHELAWEAAAIVTAALTNGRGTVVLTNALAQAAIATMREAALQEARRLAGPGPS